jgi:hypothetical protein
LAARSVIWQGDVDELVEAAGPQQGGVDDVGAIGGADDEDLDVGEGMTFDWWRR